MRGKKTPEMAPYKRTSQRRSPHKSQLRIELDSNPVAPEIVAHPKHLDGANDNARSRR